MSLNKRNRTKPNKLFTQIIEMKCIKFVDRYFVQSFTHLYTPYMHIHKRTHTHTHIYIYIYTRTHAHTHIYIYLRAHIHTCPVGWGCRIYQLLFCREVRPTNECPGYDTKQSDAEVPVLLELWGMRCTPSLTLLAGQLRPGVVALDRALSMGQIELNCGFDSSLILHLNWVFMLN